MTHRRALTLIEVLVTLFIMSIGMLALLVLFPLGALSMAQALKDDRCASTAAMAENVAIATNVRQLAAGTGSVIYVDPYGALAGYTTVGTSGIARIAPPFASTQALADRWFCLPDDIGFSANGAPDTITTGGSVDRGRRYSFAYLLRPEPGLGGLVNLSVVVYAARPIGSLALEQTFTAPLVSGTAGTNSIILNATGTSLRTGRWVLDSGNGIFYRVTNLTEVGGGTVIEVQPNLLANVNQITLMDDVVEVFDKGTGWQQ